MHNFNIPLKEIYYNKNLPITDSLFNKAHFQDVHRAGSLSKKVLQAIEALAPDVVNNSIETGCGRSTILLSNISKKHLVFTFDERGSNNSSVDYVIDSNDFKSEHTEFIFGKTIETLPKYEFTNLFDIALIDGPHAYPYPDMEYCFIEPFLRSGALLIIDDIQIPSISRMFEILAEEEIYSFIGIEETTGFLRRNKRPRLFAEFGGWIYQNYNGKNFMENRNFMLEKKAYLLLEIPASILLTSISFNAKPYLCNSWSNPTPNGTYTLGSEGSLIFNIANQIDRLQDYLFSFEISGGWNVSEKNVRSVKVIINDKMYDTWVFDTSNFQILSLKVKGEFLLKRSLTSISFWVSKPSLPTNENYWQSLGILLKSITITVA